ncbi:MAG: PLP-dependent transferase [Alphaproteobacteria bacterium]|nr:PLP-dependent transferase [Alphaproteobacteria bacterium]
MPRVPPDLAHAAPRTRLLHEGIDARIRARGVAVLHPDDDTILHDLFGAEPMVAWQEGKAADAMLQERCWSELPTVYARYGTDEGRALIRRLRALYAAEAVVVTDCGAQAVALPLDALLKRGDHAVLARQIYGKSRTFLEWTMQRLEGSVTIVDHVDAAALEEAVRPDTRVVLSETFSNPLTRALDPDAVGEAVVRLRERRAPGLRHVVDDTIATPWGPARPLLDRPGIDVVVGAGTKAVSGQDRDTFGYIASNRVPLMNEVMDLQAMRGGTLSWRSAGVLLQGLDEAADLHARRCDNAVAVAAFLAGRPDVEEVHHPSRPDHPDADVVARAYARPGSLVSFKVRDLDEDGTLHLCNVIAMTVVWRYALSFDGLVSKVNHHRTVSEHFTPAPRLRRQGIDRVVRLGCGVEEADDLITALGWALDHHRELTAEDVLAWRRARSADLRLSAGA